MADASVSALRCWYDAQSSTYFVNDSMLFAEVEDKRECDAGTAQHVDAPETSEDTHSNDTKPTAIDNDAKKSDEANETLGIKGENSDKPTESEGEVVPETSVAQDANLDAESEVPHDKNSETKVQESQSDTEAMKVTPDPTGDNAENSSNQNVRAEDKDHTSLASSKQTDKASNSVREKDAKPNYRSTKEVAYLLAFSIAREHPNPMLLEKIVTCHFS
jgi:hypothetical protein